MITHISKIFFTILTTLTINAIANTNFRVLDTAMFAQMPLNSILLSRYLTSINLHI